jgi:hypothetical protein
VSASCFAYSINQTVRQSSGWSEFCFHNTAHKNACVGRKELCEIWVRACVYAGEIPCVCGYARIFTRHRSNNCRPTLSPALHQFMSLPYQRNNMAHQRGGSWSNPSQKQQAEEASRSLLESENDLRWMELGERVDLLKTVIFVPSLLYRAMSVIKFYSFPWTSIKK